MDEGRIIMDREEIDRLWAEADEITARVGQYWADSEEFQRLVIRIQDEYGRTNHESRRYVDWSFGLPR